MTGTSFPDDEPPLRRSRHRTLRRNLLISFLVLAGAAPGAAIGAGILSGRHSTPSSSVTTPQSSANSTTPAAGGTASVPSRVPGSGGTSAVAAAVDPAVVDITATLAGQGVAKGTGMVITSSGEVLTNNHVISGATTIAVQIDGTGPTYSARVLGYDVTDDIALLQIQGVSGLQTVNIGDSSQVRVGDAVVAVGNALGRGGTPTATQGVVSALDQTITASDSAGSTETLAGAFQINALIEPGDSGGPLVDASGNVVGIDTAAQVSGRSRRLPGSTVGFAIPINAAMSIVRQIESGSSSSTVHIGERALLGVLTQDGGTRGATVVSVEAGSPAASVGLSAGDTIVSLGGQSVTSAATLRSAIAVHHPGDRVGVVWVDQSGRQHSADVQLATGPPI